MKQLSYLFLSLIVFFFASCQKDEDPGLREPSIKSVSVNSTVSKSTTQQIDVLIEKPTPCYAVSKVNASSLGTSYSYDIILESGAEVCADMIAEEVVTVSFAPQTTGEHTLNFLINGKLYQTKKVVVTE